jgi:hypothetical protein
MKAALDSAENIELFGRDHQASGPYAADRRSRPARPGHAERLEALVRVDPGVQRLSENGGLATA